MSGKRFQYFTIILITALVAALIACGSVNSSSTSGSMPPGSGGSGGGSGGSGGGSGGGGGGGSPQSVSRFIYGAIDFEEGTVDAGQIDSSSGAVSSVPGSPFNEGMGQPDTLQVLNDPKGRFLYVLDMGTSQFGSQLGKSGIAEFAIDHQSGALTTVPGGPLVFPNTNANLMAIENTGHFLFQPNNTGSAVGTGFDVYSIDQNTGALTKTSAGSNAPPVGSFSVTSPTGSFLFNEGKGLVAAFSIDTQSGALTAVGSPLSTGGSGGSMTITSDGKFLYVGNHNEANVMVFSVGGNGALTPVMGSPFAVDPGLQFLTLTPDGKFLYAQFAASANFTVKGYAVNPSAGTLTPISGAVVNNATTVTIDLSGKFAYISDLQPSQLVTYSIDPSTGALTQKSTASRPHSEVSYDITTVQ